MVKILDAIANVILFGLLYGFLEILAIKNGYSGNFPSADAWIVFDGLIIAGTLASKE